MALRLKTIESLRERCKGNVMTLGVNYRSPKYLLDVYNTYAREVLNLPQESLPTAAYDEERIGNELVILCSTTQKNEIGDVAQQAQRLVVQHPGDTTAILALNNSEVDAISECMEAMGVKHFKLSGNDLFATPEVKLLISHLAIFTNENSLIEWARILTDFHIYERGAPARNFLNELTACALCPLDLLFYPHSSYLQAFVQTYEEQEIVVFDTETTGLNIYEDDIIQIAAVKMRRGKVVEGSALSVYIETDKEIPAFLGDIVNPIIAERENHQLLSHEEALSLFLDYIGSAPLLAHNADYDYSILDNNLKRYLPERDLHSEAPLYYDSLRLARLLFPSLQQYKLKELIDEFHLDGENSHLADADVEATCSLVHYCYDESQEKITMQKAFLATRSVRERAELLRERYLPVYRATLSRLYKRQESDGPSLLADEIRRFYGYLVKEQLISPIRGIDYICKFITLEMLNPAVDYDLLSQIRNHLVDLSTLRESDLCASNIVDERIFITTIHKGKGLEFDNVIIFDVNGDRYPTQRYKPDEELDREDARKLYVALTRARRRLLIALSAEKELTNGGQIKRQLSPFLTPILPFFSLYDANGREVKREELL